MAGLKYSSHNLLLLRAYINRKMGWELSWDSNPETQSWDTGIPNRAFAVVPSVCPDICFKENKVEGP